MFPQDFKQHIFLCEGQDAFVSMLALRLNVQVYRWNEEKIFLNVL